MPLTADSTLWAIAATLFIAALGLPIPENPLLIGGGYAIFQQVTPPVVSVLLWYAAILLGDIVLFAVAYWFFTRPRMSRWLVRLAGEKRLATYQQVFAKKGGWTLFLARFAFGVRAVAYIAAGAAQYPWSRFLLIDGLSVALQVLLFIGIGYFAGERIDWAQDASSKLVLVLGILATVSLLLTWGATYLARRVSKQQS